MDEGQPKSASRYIGAAFIYNTPNIKAGKGNLRI